MIVDPQPAKVVAILEYLRTNFPQNAVAQFPKPDVSSHCFLLRRENRTEQLIYVSNEFLSDHTIEEIKTLLKEWHLNDAIRAAGHQVVVVTNQGVRVEPGRVGPGWP
jgi:hypothetical protein